MPILQIVEPRLERLAVLVSQGTPSLHGDIGVGRLVPLSYMGEGLRRLLSFVLAIKDIPGGIVLIDEFENGLHYSVLNDVWKAIAEAARQADVQIFATTHSWECIYRAHQYFVESDTYDDFRLHRLDRIGDRTVVFTYDRETFEASVTMSLEVR